MASQPTRVMALRARFNAVRFGGSAATSNFTHASSTRLPAKFKCVTVAVARIDECTDWKNLNPSPDDDRSTRRASENMGSSIKPADSDSTPISLQECK